MLLVVFLTRLDANLQAVLLRGHGTGGIGIERARWVIGLVEINDDASVLRVTGPKEAGRGIGLLAARLVLENEPQPAVGVRDRLHAERLPLELEVDDARALVAVDIPEHVQDLDVLRLRVRSEFRGDAIRGIDGKPLEPRELLAGGAVEIAEATGEPRPARVDPHREVPEDDGVLLARLERRGRDRLRILTLLGDGHPFAGAEADLPVLKREGAYERGRRPFGKNEIVLGVGADGAVTLAKPVETRDGEPAAVLLQVRLALHAPGFYLPQVRSVLTAARPGQQNRRGNQPDQRRRMHHRHPSALLILLQRKCARNSDARTTILFQMAVSRNPELRADLWRAPPFPLDKPLLPYETGTTI